MKFKHTKWMLILVILSALFVFASCDSDDDDDDSSTSPGQTQNNDDNAADDDVAGDDDATGDDDTVDGDDDDNDDAADDDIDDDVGDDDDDDDEGILTDAEHCDVGINKAISCSNNVPGAADAGDAKAMCEAGDPVARAYAYCGVSYVYSCPDQDQCINDMLTGQYPECEGSLTAYGEYSLPGQTGDVLTALVFTGASNGQTTLYLPGFVKDEEPQEYAYELWKCTGPAYLCFTFDQDGNGSADPYEPMTCTNNFNIDDRDEIGPIN